MAVLYYTEVHYKPEITKTTHFYRVLTAQWSSSARTDCTAKPLDTMYARVYTVRITVDDTAKTAASICRGVVNDRAHHKSTPPPSGSHCINFNNEFRNGLQSRFNELFF